MIETEICVTRSTAMVCARTSVNISFERMGMTPNRAIQARDRRAIQARLCKRRFVFCFSSRGLAELELAILLLYHGHNNAFKTNYRCSVAVLWHTVTLFFFFFCEGPRLTSHLTLAVCEGSNICYLTKWPEKNWLLPERSVAQENAVLLGIPQNSQMNQKRAVEQDLVTPTHNIFKSNLRNSLSIIIRYLSDHFQFILSLLVNLNQMHTD